MPASTWPPEIGDIRLAVQPADWRVALFLTGGAMVSTLFFGLAPALQATRVQPVRAMRGEGVRDARPGPARDALVALQMTGSVLARDAFRHDRHGGACAPLGPREAASTAGATPGQLDKPPVADISTQSDDRQRRGMPEKPARPDGKRRRWIHLTTRRV